MSHISLEELDLQTLAQTEPIKTPVPETLNAELERSVIVPVTLASPDTRDQLTLKPGSMIWIAEDGTELAAKLASRLRHQGFEVQCLSLMQMSEEAVPESLRGLILLTPEPKAFSASFLNQAFLALQRTGTVLRQQPAVLLTISRLDGMFGFGDLNPTMNPLSGGLAGFAKTAGREWPHVQSKAIDLPADLQEIDVIADAIVDELFGLAG